MVGRLGRGGVDGAPNWVERLGRVVTSTVGRGNAWGAAATGAVGGAPPRSRIFWPRAASSCWPSSQALAGRWTGSLARHAITTVSTPGGAASPTLANDGGA